MLMGYTLIGIALGIGFSLLVIDKNATTVIGIVLLPLGVFLVVKAESHNNQKNKPCGVSGNSSQT